MVTGQKVRWVLDMIRGTEFAGRQIRAYEMTRRDGTTVHELVLHEARGADERIDLDRAEGAAARPRRGRAHDEPAAAGRADAPRSCSTPARSTGSVGRASRPSRATAPPARRRWRDADGTTLANEHLHVVVDPTDGTYSIGPPAACGWRAAVGSSTTVTAATRTTTPRPPTTS